MEKSVVITGATGLLGRQVINAFSSAGWKVVGTGFTRANPPAILKVDIRNKAEVEKALDEAR
jgi:S-adenosylmethionine synthetase